ncbi:MAG: glycerol-3-phosphate 1-O-acyltransferase PlsY [Deltaproteobacteria bacterium]|nr:glycerol-3-phosphate 1-O-acyltransferase PlsY [Deltaproteobacteria bacterium]MBW2074300.1 glycerol-3-phosphate 1-O-acyltransferase PlsY [Deltaproteobacteria bacterium]RLB82878.1 MAG: acyl-phosphate glycerol 3-phosphate acyltransferase [Deltaproteobacteria bacterium]
MISKAIILLPFAYILGSVPWGVILTRMFSDVDVRSAGSKNIGAYNVFRVAGTKLGVMTLAGDLLKGAVPVLVAVSWFGVSDWKGEVWVCLIALSAFAGHLFPLFLGFKGGKGVATAAGCFLVITPFVFLVCVLVYVLVLCYWGYSSAGSLSAAAILPGATWLAMHSVPITACAFIMAVLIFIRHADNIRRLLKGTEHSSLRP